jgi:hypothetical protein
MAGSAQDPGTAEHGIGSNLELLVLPVSWSISEGSLLYFDIGPPTFLMCIAACHVRPGPRRSVAQTRGSSAPT